MDEDLHRVARGSPSVGRPVPLGEKSDGNQLAPAHQATVFLPSSAASESKDVTTALACLPRGRIDDGEVDTRIPPCTSLHRSVALPRNRNQGGAEILPENPTGLIPRRD